MGKKLTTHLFLMLQKNFVSKHHFDAKINLTSLSLNTH